jgi:hypothetical protein
MNLVDVYMIQDDTSRGLRYSSGYIYSVEEHVAEEYKQQGKAHVVNYQSLKAHEETVKKLSRELEDEIAGIQSNKRLSEEAKQEDIQALLTQYDVKANAIQARFNEDITTLQASAKSTATNLHVEPDFNSDQARLQAGIIQAEVEMAMSLIQAADAIQSKLDVIDKGTARELLSRFPEIKRSLEERGEKAGIRSDIKDRTIRNVYDDLRKVVQTEGQTSASLDYKVLDAIKKYRGDITDPYKTTVRKYRK